MNSKSLCVSALLFLILVAGITVTLSSGADYTHIGVRNMDTADYKLCHTGDPDSRASFYFYNVIGTMVSINSTLYFPNGTTVRTHMDGNVSRGTGFLFVYIIVAGLKAGDPIVNSSLAPTINETIPLGFAGATRLINHLRMSPAGVPSDLYWDELTGIAVKVNLNLGGGEWENITLTATSLWHSPVFAYDPTMLYLSYGAIAVSLVAVAVLLWLRGRRQKPVKK
ncbi:MAG: hypothetical protein WED04_07005 [Promethearchaeati archaeon SRVP18_Atabeyarchaeia-1]